MAQNLEVVALQNVAFDQDGVLNSAIGGRELPGEQRLIGINAGSWYF